MSINTKLALLACSAAGVMTAGILSSTATPSAPSSMTTAIVGVRVFDGVRTIPRANVVIADGKIVSVGSSPPPAGAAVVDGDGDGKTLLPGLIDAHAHVFGDALARALVFGVTTELDMFTDPAFASRMRDEQSSKRVVNRADLRSAGILATAPGGHGTEYGIKIPTVTGAADADRFVAARVKEGSDYIKIVLDDAAYGLSIPTIDQPTLKALVEAAHRWGKMAVVHIGSYRGARQAIEAGADGLAHLFADETPEADFGALVARKHAFIISTLSVLPRRSTSRGNFAVPRAAIAALRTAGVPILAGSDAPNGGTAHGASLQRELRLLIEAGLTPEEALAAATSVPARVFGLTDRGRIEPGLRADLVLVNGDPTADIERTQDIVAIWRNGAPFDRLEATRTAPPPRLAESNGLISDFDAGAIAARFGSGWVVSTDSVRGGHSTAEFAIAKGGAEGSAGSLRITGQVSPGAPIPWAGALFSPGAAPMTAVDLSAFHELRFYAKGDGSEYRVMVFADTLGPIPAQQKFVAGAEWREYVFPFSAFSNIDGRDVKGVLFSAASGQSTFTFQIDQVRLR